MRNLLHHRRSMFLSLAACAVIFLISTGNIPFSNPLPDFLRDLLARLDQVRQERPEERVYVHLDRPFYKPGETLWFAAYVREGSTLKPSAVSDVVHVELIDPKGSVSSQHQLIVRDGRAIGDFSLAAAAPGGLYKLRAYTAWMKNDPKPAIFERSFQVQSVVTPRLKMRLDFRREAYGPGAAVGADLTLEGLDNQPLALKAFAYEVQVAGETLVQGKGKTDAAGKAVVAFDLPRNLDAPDALLLVRLDHQGLAEAVSRAVPVVLDRIDLQFFAEGGDLIAGQRGRMAFRAHNEFGKPADVAGVVVDAAGDTVARFRSFHMGMGAFDLRPEPGVTYEAYLTEPVRSSRSYPLPQALPRGYGLRIDSIGRDHLDLRLYSTETENISLVTTLRDQAFDAREVAVSPGETLVRIPLHDVPMGVVRLTLFDQRGIERAERLAFVNHHRQLRIEVETDKERYLPREAVQVKVRTFDDRGLPVPAQLSLAAVDDRLRHFADDHSHHILSWLLLGADIQEEIEEPDFYFDPEKPTAGRALDYLLMTAGWRRFTWQEISRGRLPALAVLPEQTLLRGTVRDLAGQPLAGAQLLAGGQVYHSDTQGQFVIRDLDLYEPQPIEVRSPSSTRPFVYRVSAYDNDIDLRLGRMQGVVRSEAGEELAGASVMIPGTTQGVLTDHEGRFSLDVALIDQQPLTLQTSHIGYQPAQVQVQASSPLTQVQITLPSEQVWLDEVVVTGSVNGINRKQHQAVQSAPVIEMERRCARPNEGAMLAMPAQVAERDVENEGLDDAAGLEEAPAKALEDLGAADDAIEDMIAAQPIDDFIAQVPVTTIPVSAQTSNYRFYRAREFPVQRYQTPAPSFNRTDFRQTLHWSGSIETDRRGEATLSFFTSDAISAFHFTVEGIGVEGSVGRKTHKIFAQLPFSIDVRLPELLTAYDTLHLPLTLVNHSNTLLEGPVLFQWPQSLRPLADQDLNIQLKPGEARTYYLSCRVDTLVGDDSLRVAFRSKGFADQLSVPVRSASRGFPVSLAFSGEQTDASYDADLGMAVPGSARIRLMAYPNAGAEVLGGLEGLLREPHGCFEQTSSTTYPNILVLNYLQETGQDNPQLRQRALDLIARGYQRLITFETSQGGFEWFGQAPGHEGLTAYGLMEFVDMARVYDGVDRALIDRTTRWLLDRRDGRGGYTRNPRVLHQFGLSDELTNNLYITYALSEAGCTDLAVEADYAYRHGQKSQQPYQVALAANIMLNLKRLQEAQVLLSHLQSLQDQQGLWLDEATLRSAPGTSGEGLRIESTSLSMLALLKTGQPARQVLDKAAVWLRSQRNAYGSYSNTHSTVLALRALIAHAQHSKRTEEAGTIEVYANGRKVATQTFAAGQQEAIVIDGLAQYARMGKNTFRVVFREVSKPLPYTLALTWAATQPEATGNGAIDLTARLARTEARVGETVRLSLQLSNTQQEGQPMTVALIGLPAGLSAQPWQLKELQEKGVFDFYEITGQELVLYYRQMAPAAQRLVELDLKAEVPGTFYAQASRAYLYYTPEHKAWQGLPPVHIRP